MNNPEILIRDCTAPDIREMAGILRDADRREVEASGLPVNKILWRSWKGSLICKSIFVGGELAAIFGVGGAVLSEIGQVWLLTSRAAEKVSPLTFARIYQQEVLKMLKLFPVLENYVDSSYTKAVKLLQNIGFTVSEPEMFEGNVMFSKFSMRAS